MRNTSLTGPDLRPLYDVATPYKFGGRTTTVTRAAASSSWNSQFDGLDETIAVFKHNLTSPNTVNFKGRATTVREWIPKAGLVSP